MKKIFVAAMVCLLATVNAALATEVTLRGMGGSDVVFVWRSSDAHSEGMRLINANVHQTNPALVARLLACMVPSGTKAVITSAGFMTHDILVIAGTDSGCRGNVAAETVSRR